MLYGGRTDEASLTIEPTLLGEVGAEDPVMQDEIFGPVLPIMAYEEIGDAIAFINSRPKPLALYLFSQSSSIRTRKAF